MNQESVLSQFQMLLPLAAAWAMEQQEKILRDGVVLSAEEIADAHAIGIQSPDRIRLLQVEKIPRPFQPQLKAACDATDFLTPATRGLTLGYGIFIRSDWWEDRSLIVHELAHVAQYERLGGILPFLHRYLYECLTIIGYSATPLEQEGLPLPRASALSNLISLAES